MKHAGSTFRTGLLVGLLAISLAISLTVSSPGLAKKGPKISVGDDPTLGEKTAQLVLIEIADFQ